MGKGKVCDAVQRSEHVNLFRSRIKKMIVSCDSTGKIRVGVIKYFGGLLFCSKNVCFMHGLCQLVVGGRKNL